jgi:predicted pyridoxine 5'-phosphate oxidase superfamily flavin-nucleotide-binding protein
MSESEYYHAGELEVQERAGVRRQADDIGEMILPFVPPVAGAFVSAQRLAVLGSVGSDGKVWASAVIGEPGFLSIPDEHALQITSPVHGEDPLWENLRGNPLVGVLILDPATRRRIRVNGVAQLSSTGLSVNASQVYSNCTKYIQRRLPAAPEATIASRRSRRSNVLDLDQQKWINRADTFFLATFHPEAGCDASHRGGMPGFVTAPGSNELEWPDYSGNNMFQSLGNLLVYPKAGLLFLDFENGRTLQLTGGAEVIWDKEQALRFPGAKRLLKFHVDEVIATESAFAQRWSLVDYSPVNPRAETK